MITNSTLEEFILQNIKSNHKEIFSIKYQNKKYWIKKARETQSTKIHKFFYFLFKIDVLLPVLYKNAQESIIHEANKIKRLQSLGLSLPNIVFQNENSFVLEDCGETVYSYIRKSDITKKDIYYFINKAIEQLAKIHNANEYHGGAQCRNFTYKDNKVYIIDLEESFDENVDIETLQFRDFLLFILSLTKTRASFELDYKMIISKYISLTNNYNFPSRLKNLIKKISFLIKLSEMNFIYNLMGKDLKSFFRLIDILKTLDIK
jgi:tRNA A-37 threonylcarbamoyl transferase component Bud32